MKQSINFYQFCDAWDQFDQCKDSFTYEGKRALFKYLEELEEDTDQVIELDIVALDCEYAEYASFEELQDNHSDVESIEDLSEVTTVIDIAGTCGFIVQQF